MLKLNRLTDYAVVVMVQMSHRAEGAQDDGTDPVQTAPSLAGDCGIPLPTVAKILTTLSRAGLATSHRGVSGGYELSRPASEISMAEIIGALEGPIALTACVDGAGTTCEVESLCPMRGNWNKVNTAIRSALEEVKLADMAHFGDFGAIAFQPPKPGAEKARDGVI